MKNIFAYTLIIVFTALGSLSTEPLNMFNDMPLFNYRVQDNMLPQGEYVFIRSYRQITQILISKDPHTLILYTDRNNMENSDISVSAFSRFNDRILEEKKIGQWQFNFMVEQYIINGDARTFSTHNYIGLKGYIDEIKKTDSAKEILKKNFNQNELFIIEKTDSKKNKESKMYINLFWKKLIFKNKMENNGNFNKYYEIYIAETYDENIKKILRKFSIELRELLK